MLGRSSPYSAHERPHDEQRENGAKHERVARGSKHHAAEGDDKDHTPNHVRAAYPTLVRRGVGVALGTDPVWGYLNDPVGCGVAGRRVEGDDITRDQQSLPVTGASMSKSPARKAGAMESESTA